MNAQLEAMAREAGGDWNAMPPFERAALERFAQLVAKRCAEICDQMQDLSRAKHAAERVRAAMDEGDENQLLQRLRHESDVSLFNAGLDKAASAILAEFGVKEPSHD